MANGGYQSNPCAPLASVEDLFTMARHFVDLVIHPDSLVEILEDYPGILSLEFEINQENILKLLGHVGGFFCCLLIGILFLLIFPFVGVFFCCCRCCGRCGGHRKHRFGSCNQIFRKLLEVFLLVFIAFSISGILCTVVANNYLSIGVEKVGPSLINVVDDVFLFIGNTISGVGNFTEVFLLEFNSTKESIIGLLDDIGTVVGTEIVNILTTEAGLNDIITIADNLQSEASSIGTSLQLVDGYLSLMVNHTETLQAEVSTVQTLFQEAIDVCTTQPCRDALNGIKPGIDAFGDSVSAIDTTQFKPAMLNDTIYQVNQMLETNFSAMITEQFSGIPQMVNDMASSSLGPVKSMIRSVDLSEYLDPVTPMINNTLQMVTQLKDAIGIDGLISMFSTYGVQFVGYLRIGMFGFLALPGVVVLFQVVGLLLGFTCTRGKTPPDQRSGYSNTAGCCLMMSACAIFVVGWILMFLTFILFLLTTPFVVTLCRLDFQYMGRLEKFAADNGIFSVQSFIPNDFPVNLTASGVLQKCDRGHSIVEAVQLESVVNFYYNSFIGTYDVAGQLENLTGSVNLSEFSDLTSIVDGQLSGITTVIQDFDVNAIISELNAVDSLFNSSNPSAPEMADQIVSVSLSLPSFEAASAAKLNETADQLRGPVHSTTLDINDTKTDVVVVMNSMGSNIQQILTLINDTLDAVQGVQQYIQDNTGDIILSVAQEPLSELFDIVLDFIQVLLTAAHDQLKCKPLTDIYNALVHVTVCEYIVNPLISFWFCLGQIVFCFTLSLIVGVRLVKYYRRMKFSDQGEMFSLSSYQKSSPKSSNQKSSPKSAFHKPSSSSSSQKSSPKPYTSTPVKTSINLSPVKVIKEYGYVGNQKLKVSHFKNRVFPGV